MRSLIQSIGGGLKMFANDVGGAPAPWDDYWYDPAAGGMRSASGMRVSAETVKRIAAAHACVNIIGRNMSSMPVGLFRDTGSGRTKNTQHQAYRLLARKPNNWQTCMEFVQMMQGHLEFRGNGFAEIIPGPSGPADQLIPLHPDRVQPKVIARDRMVYKYNDPITHQTRTIAQEEMFHLRNWSDDGYVGQSTIAMACDTFSTALAQQDYVERFFLNDSKSGGILEGANFQSIIEEDEFVRRWQVAGTGENRHKTRILPPGVTYKPITINPHDAQLLDAMKFSRIQIASLFPVPPHLIGETEKAATYASVEQFNIMFATQCLLPRVILWEQAIRRSLIFDEDHYAKFSMANILRGDTASRFAAYAVAIANGWMCQDDVRELEDLDPIPNGAGTTYWRPANWAPLAQLTAPQPTGPGAIDDDSDAGEDPNTPEPGELTTTGSSAMHLARLKLLAASAVDRCIRKESAALRKMTERGVKSDEIRAFYASHCQWLSETLRIDANQAKDYAEWRLSTSGDLTNGRLEKESTIRLLNMTVGGVH